MELIEDICYQAYFSKISTGRIIMLLECTFFKPNLVIADLDLNSVDLNKEIQEFPYRRMYEKVDSLAVHLFFLSEKR